jgi:hypothetical protein
MAGFLSCKEGEKVVISETDLGSSFKKCCSVDTIIDYPSESEKHKSFH